MGILAALSRGLDGLFTLLVWVAAAMAAVMMLSTTTDVVMRYIFRAPVRGSFEVTEIAMGLIVFFALPKMVRTGANIRVTIVFDLLPDAARRWGQVAMDLLGAGICLLIAWRMWLYGERILRFGEVTMELRVPRGLIAQTMSALLVVTAIAFVLCAIEAARRAPPLGRDGAR